MEVSVPAATSNFFLVLGQELVELAFPIPVCGTPRLL